MNNSSLVQHIKALQGQKVICVGDVMLDRFVYGDAERISPEAPIPVLKVNREATMLGGAGNVVRNLAALGVRPLFAAAIGDDEPGRNLTLLLKDLNCADAFPIIEHGRQTTIKTRFFASGQQLLRADRESLAPLSQASRQQLLDFVVRGMKETKIVVLSDYGKGVLGEDMPRQLITAAQNARARVIVDPKGQDYSRYRGAYILTPNRKELMEATGLPAANDAEVVLAARKLLSLCQSEAILVTRSQDGMTLVEANGEISHFKAQAREVFDVSGAGDTVIATLAAALSAGASLQEAASLANTAAGIVVGKVGTAVVHADELEAALHHQDIFSGEIKLLTLEQALEKIAKWRRLGHKVGFTNGCFDLLHPGHVSLLKQAREACDRLIVGLNSDSSVKRLKGEARPVQNEASRAVVLGSLAMVDAVIIFGQDTPKELIEALRPDVLIKGADYTIDKVVGAEFVQSYGGRIVLANLAQGHSTTSTIARINQG